MATASTGLVKVQFQRRSRLVSTAPSHALIFALTRTLALVLQVLNLTALRLLAFGEQKILFIINCDIL